MTFVSFPDITAVSPGRKFHVEIRGSAAEDDFFRDQSGFVYQLFAAETESRIWQWSPTEQDGLADYPHEAWVNDDGWVVVRLHEWFSAGLLVLSPNGERRMLRYLQNLGEGEPGLLQNETASHIGGTSAGPNWEASSIAVFFQFGGRPFWSILTWWGRRIVIDLEDGTPVNEICDEQQSVIEETEQSWILDQLQSAQSGLQLHDDSVPNWWSRIARPVYAAAFHAGPLDVQAATPLLRGLETSPVSGYSTSHSRIDVVFLPFRLIAKIALLRLGVEPRWFANFVLTDQRTGQRCNYQERAEPRSPEMIDIGVSERELLRQIGAPEFLRHEWDYCFFDSGSALTVRVKWHDRHELRMDWKNKHEMDAEFERYREAVDREPPVASRVKRIEDPPWLTHDYDIAHQC